MVATITASMSLSARRLRNSGNVLAAGAHFLAAAILDSITSAGTTNQPLYLPLAGAPCYNFWTGASVPAGQRIEAAAPVETMPLFVKPGSILPLGPFLQYSSEKPADPIELRIYRGADGKFTLYDDEHDTYNYEKGKFATIPISWNNAKHTLEIGKRSDRKS